MLVLLPVDLVFRVVVYFPGASMWTLGHAEMRNAAFVRAYLGILPLELSWMLAFAWLLAPVDRWREARALGQSTPALLGRATRAAYRAPQRMMIVYGVQWSVSTLYAYMLVRNQLSGSELPAGAGAALLLTVATVAIGAAAVAFTLTSWTLGELTNELSVAARVEGVVVHETSLPLRRRLGLISLFIGGAPGCWIGALACSEHFSSSAHVAGDPFDLMLPLELAGCALFSLLCAWMFAATLTNPVARMRGVVADIIRRGDVAQVERLPVQARDEMGALAEGVNDMIDRLEQVEQARRQIAAHLADMNLRLEAQVRQRTQSLEETNVALRREIGERERMEVELRLAQKLEAIGRLASGVAHEINTPVQYVTDSLQFVRDAMQDLQPLIRKYQEVQASVVAGAPALVAASEAAELAEQANIEYVLNNLAPALDRSLDGLGQVTTIVRSMKQFAHLDRAAADVDLNQTVSSTLEIARNEYKYVADLAIELADVPRIPAYPGELGQVILNLVVNAAHAIRDVVKSSGARGKIAIKTWADREHVWLSIADTGGGIPEAIRSSIFDPFFTTKEVGQGTGQGLAIVHSVIAKHRGDVRFTTAIGEGTTFTVRLPIAPLATLPGAA